MKSMWPALVAIFYDLFSQGKGGHAPLAPPGSATVKLVVLSIDREVFDAGLTIGFCCTLLVCVW